MDGWEGRIDSLTQEGLGVGTMIVDGRKRPIFIPFTTPGDTVRARITRGRGKYIFGEIESVISPSPYRLVPRCPHFMTCGGCNLQHVAYEEQLRQKSAQVAFLIRRKGIALEQAPRVLPSRRLHKYRWRNRIAIRFSPEGITAGFRKHRSREIVKVTRCDIVAPEIRELITLINAQPPPGWDVEVEVTAIVSETRKTGLVVPTTDLPEGMAEKVGAFFTDLYAHHRDLVGNLFLKDDEGLHTVGQVQERFAYHVDGLEMLFLPDGFIQANIPTNEVLVKESIRALAPAKEETVLDLYCGNGNLSLPIAKRVSKVIGVEGSESGITAAGINALRNGTGNAEFHHQPVEEYLAALTQRPGDKVVLDPPRTGCSPEVIDELKRLAFPTILYVSCDPITLAADIAALGYAIESIVCIDMYPDTPHVESIVRLKAS